MHRHEKSLKINIMQKSKQQNTDDTMYTKFKTHQTKQYITCVCNKEYNNKQKYKNTKFQNSVEEAEGLGSIRDPRELQSIGNVLFLKVAVQQTGDHFICYVLKLSVQGLFWWSSDEDSVLPLQGHGHEFDTWASGN